MRPPRTSDRPSRLARYTPDSRRWRRIVAVAAPLSFYAAVAVISGVKSGMVYNLLVAVFGILALTLPAVAATVLLAPDGGRPKTADDGDSVETLKRRYAAGAIDDAEFERRLDALVETEAKERSGREPVRGDTTPTRETESAR